MVFPSMSRLILLLGIVAGLAVPLAAGELFVRLLPPDDLQEYLGAASPQTGIYRPDPTLGADYVSFDAFQQSYAARLAELSPLGRPCWAWFGNSFVQAPGMLGDTADAAFLGCRAFYLRRNEPLHLRVAQVRLLLQNGLHPQRIIFVILPIDVVLYPAKPLSSILVNARGAITHRARLPSAPFDRVMSRSRLALLAWVRSGRQAHDPGFKAAQVMDAVPAVLERDLGTMLGVLSEAGRRFDVPITLLLIPNREQILGKGAFALQNTLARVGNEAGLDVFDARDVFREQTDKRGLFLPDWHFSALGNRLLFAGLLAHLRWVGAGAPMIRPGAEL